MSTLLSTSGLPDALEPLGGTPVHAVDPRTPRWPTASWWPVPAQCGQDPRGRTCLPEGVGGTGFVIAPNRVMSNAHVVAGSESVTVEAEDGTTCDATVVSYDPDADISILDVPNLPIQPLQFAEEPAKTGTDAVVLRIPRRRGLRGQPGADSRGHRAERT